MIKKRGCSTFIEDSSNGALCQCGRPRKNHSDATGDFSGATVVSQWDSALHSSEYPTDAFGELEFPGAGRRHSHFLRLSCDTQPKMVYKLMTDTWGIPRPNLVVSVVGGEGHEKLKAWVRDVLRNGLVRSAQSTGAWILTEGLREGVGRCVGEAVRDHSASSPSQRKVIAMGVAPWGLVQNRTQLVNAQGSFPARYYVQNTAQDSMCLDNNYHAFLLVDDGRVGWRGGETAFRASLEEYISRQRTGIWGSGSIEIPMLCMLISGDASMLERVDLSLKKATPWLVLADTGPAADLISEVLGEGPITELRDRTCEKVRRHFPVEADLEKLVDRTLSIYQNKDLITLFNGQQDGPDDFDTVILKALVTASKRVANEASEHTEELKLAVAWDRVDVAKTELFNGDIQWKYNDLEDLMTDALVNDKPQFVRLFCENGFNILDYLTHERLELLYRSLDNSSLVYTLLQRHLSERQGLAGSMDGVVPGGTQGSSLSLMHAGPASAKELSLHEVSGLQWDLLGDVCQPFYKPLGLDQSTGARRIGRGRTRKKVNKLLFGECTILDKHYLSPWSALFVWAVLQNRSDMAIYFWEMAGESVLSALSGCKILRELSKLEGETRTKVSMRELAQTFENLANDVFSQCYKTSESHSFTLLMRKSTAWAGATCLQMATAADARLFFSHDGVQSLLSQVWWGYMDRSTEVWKLVFTFFLPPLMYTNLISYREQEVYQGPGQDTDSLYGSVTSLVSLDDIVKTEQGLNGRYTSVFSLDHLDIVKIQEDEDEHDVVNENLKGSTTSSKQPFAVQRWLQFWSTPVTLFLANVLMYFVFLGLFAYVLLVDFKPLPERPSYWELVLYFWVFTLVLEEIRQTFFVGSTTVLQGMKNYFQDIWNKCDVAAIGLFALGLVCRMFPWSYNFGRTIMALDYMVFTLRLIHIFAIHKQLGPKIIIVGKMMKDMFFFLTFLGVWLMAYGVANQALLYSYDIRPKWIFHRVFYRPYLLIFDPKNEMDDELDTNNENCTTNRTLIDDGWEPCMDTYAHFVVVLLLVIYLLVINILLVNLLIAIFSNTFSKVQEHSDTYWKFQRYNLILEYHNRPGLAPPFIILSHILLFIKRHIRCIPHVKIRPFVLELESRKACRLNTWEGIQKETLLTARNKRQRESDAAQIKCTSFKVDSVLKKMSEMTSAASETRSAVVDHDRRLRRLEIESEYCCNALSWMVEALSESNLIKTTRQPPQRCNSTTPTL